MLRSWGRSTDCHGKLERTKLMAAFEIIYLAATLSL